MFLCVRTILDGKRIGFCNMGPVRTKCSLCTFVIGNKLRTLEIRNWSKKWSNNLKQDAKILALLRMRCVTLVVYHLHEKTVWFTVWAIGKQIPYCDIPFGTGVYHLHKSFPFTERVWNWYQRWGLTKWNMNFRSEIPFGNFGLPFKKWDRFPRKFSIWEDQTGLSIYTPTEISGFFL